MKTWILVMFLLSSWDGHVKEVKTIAIYTDQKTCQVAADYLNKNVPYTRYICGEGKTS